MKSYIDYNEYGIKEIRCMNCDTPVATQGEVYIPFTSRTTIGTYHLSNYTQIRLDVKIDGRKTFINPIICKSCASKDVDEEKIITQVIAGWNDEMTYQGKNEREKDKYLEKMSKIVVEKRVF